MCKIPITNEMKGWKDALKCINFQKSSKLLSVARSCSSVGNMAVQQLLLLAVRIECEGFKKPTLWTLLVKSENDGTRNPWDMLYFG